MSPPIPEQPTCHYTQFVEHYRRYTNTLKRSMRQQHRAGEMLFIDYAGPTLPVIDPATGEIRRAHIFVAGLGPRITPMPAPHPAKPRWTG